MNREELLEIVRQSVCEETMFDRPDLVHERTTAEQVPGWDSLAHVRIVLSIEMETNTEVEIRETYGAKNVGELVSLFSTARSVETLN